MKRYILILLVLLCGCVKEEGNSVKVCRVGCALNFKGDPLCAVKCPDGYIYYFFPQERNLEE